MDNYSGMQVARNTRRNGNRKSNNRTPNNKSLFTTLKAPPVGSSPFQILKAHSSSYNITNPYGNIKKYDNINKNSKSVVYLLDVDGTLVIDKFGLNRILLEELRGKQVHLFTRMTDDSLDYFHNIIENSYAYPEFTNVIRSVLIMRLKNEFDIDVLSVITPGDYITKIPGKYYADFIKPTEDMLLMFALQQKNIKNVDEYMKIHIKNKTALISAQEEMRRKVIDIYGKAPDTSTKNQMMEVVANVFGKKHVFKFYDDTALQLLSVGLYGIFNNLNILLFKVDPINGTITEFGKLDISKMPGLFAKLTFEEKKMLEIAVNDEIAIPSLSLNSNSNKRRFRNSLMQQFRDTIRLDL